MPETIQVFKRGCKIKVIEYGGTHKTDISWETIKQDARLYRPIALLHDLLSR